MKSQVKMKLWTLKDGQAQGRAAAIHADATCDILVAGLGAAGALAVIAAARGGRRVIGIEATSCLGGIMTGGAIHGYYHGTTGGLQMELDKATDELGARYAAGGAWGYNPDARKVVFEQAALAAGATLCLQTRVIGVWRSGRRVTGLQVAGPDGIRNLAAPVVIDATGDADVCAIAGATFRLGRDLDGMPQPYSLPRGFLSEDGKIGGANFDAGYVNPTDARELSRAIVHGQTLHLRSRYTGTPRMLYAASILGLREGRFINGEATVSFMAMLDEAPVPHAVFYTQAHHDNHARDWAFESDTARDWATVCGFWGRTTRAQVPYECLIPKDLDGVLVAGRCVSMDHDAAQTFRMQRDMEKLGEVAGTAAVLAVAQAGDVRQVPWPELQERLRATGCLPDAIPAPFAWPTAPDAIRAKLNSTEPGEGLWGCRRLGPAAVSFLRPWLADSEPERLRLHSAMALALVGDAAGAPLLRRMLEQRDMTKPEGWNGHPHLWAACHLLAKLGDLAAEPTLTALLQDPNAGFGESTHAFMALRRLAAQAPAATAARISQLLHAFVAAPGRQVAIPLQVSGSAACEQPVTWDLMPLLRRLAARPAA